MSKQNKVNPGSYTQAGRLSQDDVAREMKKQKIAIHTNTKVEGISDGERGAVKLTLGGGKTLEVDTVLVATGRKPSADAIRAGPHPRTFRCETSVALV